MITFSINVSKLDKSKFVKGEKGVYCDLVLIETPNGQYGDYMVKQDSTKEEREAGRQMPILGNAKNRERKQSTPDRPARQMDEDGDEIPF